MTAPNTAQNAAPTLPLSRRDDVTETLHGVEVSDPYRWLEDQDSPETREWIDAQNAYTHHLLDTWAGREVVEKRLTELLKIDTIGTPTARNGSYFFSRRRADQDLPVVYRRKGVDGADEVLLDPHPLSEDHMTSVSLLDVSTDAALVAYGIRQGGEDEVEIHFRQTDSGHDLADVMPHARYFGLSLKTDKSGFFYAIQTDDGPRLRYHALGTDPASDVQLFGEDYGPDKILYGGLSEDGNWLLITVLYGSAAKKTELYLKDVANDGPIVAVVNDIEARFQGDIGGDTLYLETNWNAPNSRILAAPLTSPTKENWREIVPESANPLEYFALVGGKLCAVYLENVTSKPKILNPDGTYVRDLTLPALGSIGGLSGQWDSPELFYSFSSFPIPTTIYRYDLNTDQRDIWAKLDVPVNTDDMDVEQVWAASKDGTKVPMFLVYRKGLKRDGSHPTLLYGYGGFNATLTPFYSNSAVLWAENNGIYAVANLRGGGEFGEAWHEAGMQDRKQNTFDDFIACAEFLIHENYTQPSKLSIMGGSNGGLLVGAAETQRPDLFGAVVCSVPLLDMVRYHQFLVARFWVPEYGSSENPDEFQTLFAYSPYHRVVKGTKYPATLFVTGDADTRVAPLHARKMAALLQAETGSEDPILLHYDTKAGHSGGQPISKTIADLTDQTSFLFWQLGVSPKM